MVQVKSLSLRIVMQFAAILLPLVAVLVYQNGAQASRAAEMQRAVSLRDLSTTAREHYRAFLNGAVDAVDTGRLSAAAVASLGQTVESADRLAALDVENAASLRELSRDLHALADTLRHDASLAQLGRLRDPISDARAGLDRTTHQHDAGLDEVVRRSIRDSARSQDLVTAVTLLLLLVTAGFIAQMTRGLSRPLRLAVDLADRIAAGAKVAPFRVDPSHDIGNLLGSLQRMHASLIEFEGDVERQRAGLERTVAELAKKERSLAHAQRSAKLGNWEWDTRTAAAAWSDEMRRIVGRPAGDAPPTLRDFLRAVPAAERSALAGHFRDVADRADEVAIEHRIVHVDGDERIVHHQVEAQRDAAGRLLRLCGTVQDITDRQRLAERMRRLAMYDGLTGIANRSFFNEHLRATLAHAKRHGTGLATLFIDLDRFKRINDTLGHAVGDALLRQAAERLRASVREGDTAALAEPAAESMVARLGGDEFVVLLRDVLMPRDAAVVAARLVDALSKPFAIDGHELVVTASIGIAMHPTDGDDAESLIRAADAAMYAAKQGGRNAFQFFCADMNTLANERLTLEGELRHAIDRHEFVLHYQPKVDIATGEVFGVEALIRWQHPKWGLIPPARFISLAEELGLIAAIGDWVLEESCRQAAQWKRQGLGEVSIAVNLASPSFRRPQLVEDLSRLLARHAVDPRQLQIEATETMLMESAGATLQTLKKLHGLGVKLSIDDFGTGYSSLSYLRRFPVDQLKIDRSFVSEMAHNTDDAAIAGAIVSLARNMKREVVAEGVETIEQARMLRAMGCVVMQGFLFSKPLPAADIETLLRCGRPFEWATESTSA